MIQGSDIVYVLSGGSSNTNPNLSLGGEASGYTIQGSLNNLFSNVGVDEATAGNTDYRCIYIFNNSETDTLWEAVLYISSQIGGGSTIAVGVQEATDIQQICITGIPTGGSATFSYEEDEFTVAYNANPATFAANFKTALVNLGLASDITVEIATTSEAWILTVNFVGDENLIYHEKIELVANNLTQTTEIETIKISNGSPRNSVAPVLATDRTIPNGVTFLSPTASSPISIGVLKAGWGFPVWIRRTTPGNVAAIEDDGFTLTLKGVPIAV